VYKADGEAAAWTDTFAGDMHGCVPLGLVDGKFMRLRPSVGYELSSPIEVPVEPVTGKSMYVVCMPRYSPAFQCFISIFAVYRTIYCARETASHRESTPSTSFLP